MPRLYTITLLFLLFEIALVLLLPIAAAFQSHKLPALIALFFFLLLPMIAYAYLWRFNYLGTLKPPAKPAEDPNP